MRKITAVMIKLYFCLRYEKRSVNVYCAMYCRQIHPVDTRCNNDAPSFWRHNDVIITPRVLWVPMKHFHKTILLFTLMETPRDASGKINPIHVKVMVWTGLLSEIILNKVTRWAICCKQHSSSTLFLDQHFYVRWKLLLREVNHCDIYMYLLISIKQALWWLRRHNFYLANFL